MTWMLKYLPPLTAAVIALALTFIGPVPPRQVFAGDCSADATGTLVIVIEDNSTGEPLASAGTEVLIKPDPLDFTLDQIVPDTAHLDAASTTDVDQSPGIIRYEDACSTEGSETYTISVWSIPSELQEDCDVTEVSASTALAPDETAQVVVVVDCGGLAATATAEASPTAAPAATVTVLASPLSVSCSGSSVLTIQLRDAAGASVGAGAPVAVTAGIGTINPGPNLETNDAGNVITFFTAPPASGGTAVITATSGSVSGTASVTVNCGAGSDATVAPPPSSGAGTGFITPPNTGSAGLITRDRGDLPVWIGTVFLVATCGGFLSIAWRRIHSA